MSRRTGRWFRFYENTFENEKVLALSDKEFRLWLRLLCLASENDGRIPSLTTLKARFNARKDHLERALKRLIEVGLIDCEPDGFTPRNWRKFQYKSDTSAERTRRYRGGDVTSQSSITRDTETDTDTEYYPSQDKTRYEVGNTREPFRVIGGAK